MAACITRPGRCAPATASPGGACSTPSARATAFHTGKCGKLIVATNDLEQAKIEGIHQQGLANDVEGLALVSGAQAARPGAEPYRRRRRCLSPETGIVDSHAFMLALQGDLEDAGGVIAFNTTIERLDRAGRGLGGPLRRRDPGGCSLDAVVNTREPRRAGARAGDRGLSGRARAEARAGQGQLFRLPRPAGLLAPDLSGAGRGRAGHAPDARSCRPHAVRTRCRVDRAGGLRGRSAPGGQLSTPRSGAIGPDCPTGRCVPIMRASAPSSPAPASRPRISSSTGRPSTACSGLVHLFGIELPGAHLRAVDRGRRGGRLSLDAALPGAHRKNTKVASTNTGISTTPDHSM